MSEYNVWVFPEGKDREFLGVIKAKTRGSAIKKVHKKFRLTLTDDVYITLINKPDPKPK